MVRSAHLTCAGGTTCYIEIDMTVDAIKEARDTTPFKPFVIRTPDGNGFEVPNHDCLLVAEGGRTLIVVTPDERFHILATELVSSISR